MSIKDRFNRFFTMDDDEDYLEEEGADFHSFYEEPQQSSYHYEQVEEPVQKESSQKVVKLRKENNQANIKIMEPRIYSEVTHIADCLLKDFIVVVNFQKAEEDQAKKMIDFIAGTVYAIKGDMQKVGEGIFICAPSSIGIDGLADSFSEFRHL